MPQCDQDDQKREPSAEPRPSPSAAALFKARTVLFFGEVEQASAEQVVAQLLALDAESAAPIRLFINSPGGHVESGDTVHDVLGFLRAPVYAIGTGWVASAGAHIFLGVPRERRVCLPNTRFLLHQPRGGMRGQASDIEIEATEVLKMRERLCRIIARETGRELEQVLRDTDRNFWMTADEALAYGLVSRIVRSAAEVG